MTWLLLQFWIHTTCVRQLGVLEWVLNTPSHHRVHHDRRVHRNYGGFSIIWDRLLYVTVPAMAALPLLTPFVVNFPFVTAALVRCHAWCRRFMSHSSWVLVA